MGDNRIKTTSIARKIHRSFWFKKLKSTILFDLFLGILFMAGIFMKAMNELDTGLKDITKIYFETEKNGDVLFCMKSTAGAVAEVSVTQILEPMRYVFLAILTYQLLGLIFAMFGTGKIREKLKPIDELAAAAEKIGAMQFDFNNMSGGYSGMQGGYGYDSGNGGAYDMPYGRSGYAGTGRVNTGNYANSQNSSANYNTANNAEYSASNSGTKYNAANNTEHSASNTGANYNTANNAERSGLNSNTVKENAKHKTTNSNAKHSDTNESAKQNADNYRNNRKHLENLEQAIANVRADEDNIRIETCDEDLKSIENSLNTLLRRLKENEKQQVRFVSDASHELRTPIAVIQGYVNMLDRWGTEDPAVLAESIEALKKETEYMKELIEQLLFLARGDSGRCSMNMVDFNLADVVKEVWEESLLIDERHRYELKLNGRPVSEYEQDEDFDDTRTGINGESGIGGKIKCMMHGDVALIKQSIRVFVTNAAKYTAEGDAVILAVSERDGQVSYMIQDEGIGIEDKDLGHIFERFYRADEARNGQTGGTGLGLSIAKWIIDAHKGSAQVVSRSGIGTRFEVTFPKVETAGI